MMKKLLVFMFVLALVSSANASIVTFYAGGSAGTVNVLAGATIEITVKADTDSITGYSLTMKETKSSSAGYATATALGVIHTGFATSRVNGTLRNTMSTAPTSATQRYILIDKIVGLTTSANTVAAGQVLYTYSVKVPTLAAVGDTFTITAATGLPNFGGAGYPHQINAGNVTTTNEVILNVIPEPMTIALLGLGSMFMLRRRR